MLHLIAFSRYQTKCVTSDDITNLKIFLESTSTAMADKKNRGEDTYTKIWISWARKELFRWNQEHFS